MRNRAASAPPFAALSLALLLTACGGGQPAGTPVTSLADSGPGSLREVLAAAKDGDTLRFATPGTVTLASPVTVDKDVTLLAEGVTLDAAGKGRALEVAAGAEVLLKGGTLKGGVGQVLAGTALAPTADPVPTYGGLILNSGTLTLDGVTVTGGKANIGGGIANLKDATLTLKAGTNVTGNTAEGLAPGANMAVDSGFGGGIHNGGTLTLAGGAVNANTATYIGGGIRNAGTLTVQGGSVNGNTCTSPFRADGNNFYGCIGGGIYSTGPVTLSGGTVNGNTSTLIGGGLQVIGAALTMSGGEVSGNTTTRAGGGMFLNTGSTLTLSGGTIANNKATDLASGGGGGILSFKSVLNMSGGLIKGNSAGVGGGIDAFTENKVTMTGGTVEENTARSGGGLHVNTRSTMQFTGGTVQNNTANEYGGGITVSGAQGVLTLGGTATVRGNKAGIAAGGIDVGGATLNMAGGTVEGNSAVTTGGGLTIGGTVNMTGGTISANRATGTGQGQGGGGGIRMYTNGVMTASGGSISNNTALYGGGVLVDGIFNNEPAAQFTLAGATVSNNRATDTLGDGGGFFNAGKLTIQSGSVTGNTARNRGGGVRNTSAATYAQPGGSVTGNTPDNVATF